MFREAEQRERKAWRLFMRLRIEKHLRRSLAQTMHANRIGWLVGFLWMAGALGQTPAGHRDAAFYRDFSPSEREAEEEDARDRARAERKGLPFNVPERKPSRRLTLDFSKIERPRTAEEFTVLRHLPPEAAVVDGQLLVFTRPLR